MTTWTERSSPPSTTWHKRPIKIRKRPDNFYEGKRRHSFVGVRYDANKRSDDFYELGGATFPGDYALVTRTDNFVENRER